MDNCNTDKLRAEHRAEEMFVVLTNIGPAGPLLIQNWFDCIILLTINCDGITKGLIWCT